MPHSAKTQRLKVRKQSTVLYCAVFLICVFNTPSFVEGVFLLFKEGDEKWIVVLSQVSKW